MGDLTRRRWLIAAIGVAGVGALAVAAWLVARALGVGTPTTQDLQARLDDLRLPGSVSLVYRTSSDNCMARCPSVYRAYLVPAPAAQAQQAFRSALSEAGYSHREMAAPLGEVWVRGDVGVTVRDITTSPPSTLTRALASIPRGTTVLAVQASHLNLS